jgi:hypothetical protein
MPNRSKFIAGILGVAIFVGAGSVCVSEPDAKCGAQIQVLPERHLYSPGATARIKLIVTNVGIEPLYFFRGMSECSSPIGSFYLIVLDRGRHEVNESGCSIEVSFAKMDLEKELKSSKSGIMLKSGEIYGIETELKLPTKPGDYTLQAQLIPAAVTTEQREKLAANGVTVLKQRCVAPKVLVQIRRNQP